MKYKIGESSKIEIKINEKIVHLQVFYYERGEKLINFYIVLDYYPVKNTFIYELVNRQDLPLFETYKQEHNIKIDNIENLNIGTLKGGEKIINIGCLIINLSDYLKLDLDDIINISLHSHIDSKEKCLKRAEKVYKIMLEYNKIFKE